MEDNCDGDGDADYVVDDEYEDEFNDAADAEMIMKTIMMDVDDDDVSRLIKYAL